ncbi:MAG: FG-GAP-like repeat-containing protein, partial [Bacteroidota bacterium]
MSLLSCLPSILLFLLSVTFAHSQWLDFIDVTDSHLSLSTVANSDNEEKDFEPADLNNDGFTDLIVARKVPFSLDVDAPKTDLLLMNVGGELVDQTELYAPGFLDKPTHARDLFIGDFDNDGWQDVVFANTFEQEPLYYRNLGNDSEGNWLGLEDETAQRFPAQLDDAILMCAVKGGDLDGDGDMDLYFVNYRVNGNGGVAKDFLFINDGNGYFVAEGESRLGILRNSAFGTEAEIKDIDNDGDNDIVKISTLYEVPPWNEQGIFVLYNDGSGNFETWQNISQFASDAVYMMEIEDFNLDGKLDVYVVDDGMDFALTATDIYPDSFINYSVQFIAGVPGIAGFGGNVHAGDFDRDGDMDIAVADVDVDIPPCYSNRRYALFRNDNGLFVYPFIDNSPDWAVNVYDFSILDINNDGLQDFVTGKCEGYSVFLSSNCELAVHAADFDEDGIADACDVCPADPDPFCSEPPAFPIIETSLAVPRQWNEMLLASIRRDLARPTVHARNLFHLSAAMWDVWASFKEEGCTYLFGQTVNDFNCGGPPFTPTDNSVEALETAISYTAYRLLSHRFANSVNGDDLQDGYDYHMSQLGLDIGFTDLDYSSGSAAALGNYIANCYIEYGLLDNSNEQNDYENTSYEPVNDPLIVDNPGNPSITFLNRWQPLTLEIFIDQSGNVIPGNTPGFLSPEWGSVFPFGLDDSIAVNYERGGTDFKVYHDPGSPPLLQESGLGQSADYQWGFATVCTWSSHLDPSDGVMWDISPAGIGNVNTFPTDIADFNDFYDQLDGGAANSGHSLNPITGQPYSSNMVPRGDYARVIAEFWADGPDSETPPGHWFTILNEYVTDHPEFERKIAGQGEEVDEIEWYVKSYFMLGGAMHDVAVTAWGVKGWYDYLRPISAIRAMADLGQSTDPALASYNPAGIPLIPGYIELVETGDPLAGPANVNAGKIKLWAWAGHDEIDNVDTDAAGVDWILAEDWMPYQRPSFVTPNFAGYVSGHSTFSSAAATLLTALTGTAYFPGGMGSFLAEQDEFLVFENGPSVDVELQWATYFDAANESALSRIWGGIHPPADDVPGRIMGLQIGQDAFTKAMSYFEDEDGNGLPDLCQGCVLGDPCDDNDPTTGDDVFVGPCDCLGTPCPFAGLACDDGDPATFDDVTDGLCGCAGIPCPAEGTSCDDGDPATYDDVADGFCGCAGIPCPAEGTACDDGDPATYDDVSDGFCGCAGIPCPAEGTACDDGDPATYDDVSDGFCGCAGIPCPAEGT